MIHHAHEQSPTPMNRFWSFVKKHADTLMAVATATFILSLLPTVLSSTAAVPLLTSIPTSLALYLTAVCLRARGLNWAAGTTLLTASEWAFIAAFRHG